MSFPLRETVCILLNTEEKKPKTKAKTKKHKKPTNTKKPKKAKNVSLPMSSNHFYPACGFPDCMSFFIIDFLNTSLPIARTDDHSFCFSSLLFSSPLTPPPSLNLCSVFACMEGLVFLFSQLSTPGSCGCAV